MCGLFENETREANSGGSGIDGGCGGKSDRLVLAGAEIMRLKKQLGERSVG
jgi:hypothetical protein